MGIGHSQRECSPLHHGEVPTHAGDLTTQAPRVNTGYTELNPHAQRLCPRQVCLNSYVTEAYPHLPTPQPHDLSDALNISQGRYFII